MTSKPVAFLLADLGVTKSHSRPHVSNDNPYSESQFKTLKYRPDFPDRFASIEAARAFCQRFFPWYNHEHRHTGLGLHTAADVHYGRAQAVQAARGGRARRRLRRPSRTVRPPAAATAAAADRRLDQPPRSERNRRSVKAARQCLIQVDRFRHRVAPVSCSQAVPDYTVRARSLLRHSVQECGLGAEQSRWRARSGVTGIEPALSRWRCLPATCCFRDLRGSGDDLPVSDRDYPRGALFRSGT